MPLEEMLYAIAVGSANDAAVAVAEHLGGSEPAFVEMMNQRAIELGATNTQFQNPSGLPPASVGKTGPHVTSAYDMAMISRHAITLPMFLELTSTWGPVTMRPNGQQKPVLWSFNHLLRSYPGMDGIKTGMTNEAGFCLAATAERDGLRLIAVTLGAATREDRDNDIRRLLDYGFSRLKAVTVVHEGEHVTDAQILKGRIAQIPLIAKNSLHLSMEKESTGTPTTSIEYIQQPTAPIQQGQTIAYLIASLNGEEVGRVELVAGESVERAGIFQMIGHYFSRIVSITK